jgi:hypothetical protein
MGSNRIRTRQAHAARTKEAATKSPEEQHEEVTRANTERILRALDDFANPAARLGVGSSNLLEGTQYPLTRITRLYMLMQSLYRSNWVAQRIADTYPELMCKVPPVLTCQVKPKDLDSFYRAIEQYQVWAKLEWTMKLANVFGGAGAVIIIDGHENFLDEPLDLDDIKPGAFKGIIPVRPVERHQPRRHNLQRHQPAHGLRPAGELPGHHGHGRHIQRPRQPRAALYGQGLAALGAAERDVVGRVAVRGGLGRD